LATANNATTISTDRGKANPTNRSGPTPHPINTRANRFARAFSSAYDSSSPWTTRATASGVRATCAANNSGNVTPGTGVSVSFHSTNNRSRSTPLNNGNTPTG
jgi:hypothetical protein